MDHLHTTSGVVTSVFDILYSNQTQILNDYLSRLKKDGDSVAEVIVYDLLNKILADYEHLKFAMHISINKLIKDYSFMNPVEIKYISNNWTHVDFLIYNNLTKENVLIVEVDGIRYHEQNELQLIRDSIKDKAVRMNGIKMIRIKTNESHEENKIRILLNNV
jgi:hypothetical protein